MPVQIPLVVVEVLIPLLVVVAEVQENRGNGDVEQGLEGEFEKFDFGRGAESYKYWFANEDALLINLEFPCKNGGVSIFKKALHKCIKTIKGGN